MNILEASRSSSLLEAALGYAQLGISVVPLVGKMPSIVWAPFQTRAASFGMIHGWNAAGKLNNVGVVCGGVSGNLVVVDCDGLAACDAFESRFPDLSQTFCVATGSGKGAHFYFYADIPIKTTRITGLEIGNIELRSDGCYVVAPPSIHPLTGAAYHVPFEREVIRVRSLSSIAQWIESMRPKNTAARAAVGGEVRNASRYGAAALKSEADKVRTTASGGRNAALYTAALKMGSLIAAGHLDRVTVETALFDAAIANGYVNDDGEAAARKTIASGLRNGMGNGRGNTTR